MQGRFLITCPDERTWKFDRPVIFISEWCRRYNRRHIWFGMDAIDAKPYGLTKEQKDKDQKLIHSLEEEFILILQNELNQVHGVDHTVRYWKIVLGHWLRRYLEVIVNRFNGLSQCLNSNNISGISFLQSDKYSLATVDSLAFVWASDDEIWNNFLYSRVLKFIPNQNVPFEFYRAESETGFKVNQKKQKGSFKSRIKQYILKQINILTNFFVSDKDAFIINSFLLKKKELELQLRLYQAPKTWVSPLLKSAEIDQTLRKKLAGRVSIEGEKSLSNCIKSMLFELIPGSYLEGYNEIKKQISTLSWPKTPRFIFTSNNFDTDEVFKIWAAQKVENKVPYYIGQHGNNYGTFRYLNPSLEEITSDKFLTWGWKDGLVQHTPAFIFKLAGRKFEYNEQGGLLLIEFSRLNQIYTWDVCAEFSKYFQNQVKFTTGLPEHVRKHLTIRLHHATPHYGWFENERWADIDPNLNIDAGFLPISELIKKGRLVIHSYDSTGILETLALNIPTLAFWLDGLSHLRDSAVPYYQVLIDAGIVHLSTESALQKVNEIWDDIPAWWQSNAVQNARRDFCSRYAKISNEPLKDLLKIFS